MEKHNPANLHCWNVIYSHPFLWIKDLLISQLSDFPLLLQVLVLCDPTTNSGMAILFTWEPAALGKGKKHFLGSFFFNSALAGWPGLLRAAHIMPLHSVHPFMEEHWVRHSALLAPNPACGLHPRGQGGIWGRGRRSGTPSSVFLSWIKIQPQMKRWRCVCDRDYRGKSSSAPFLYTPLFVEHKAWIATELKHSDRKAKGTGKKKSAYIIL